MNDLRLKELAAAVIDGEATDVEMQLVEDAAKSSPEFAQHLASLRELCTAIDDAARGGDVPDLTAAVMTGIHQHHPAGAASFADIPRPAPAINTPPQRGPRNVFQFMNHSTGARGRAMNNRKASVLIGFGTAAAIVAGLFLYWPPAFMEQDASGAIGVVRKHRAPQINSGDVVLTNEASRVENHFTFAGPLAEAAGLRSISADILANRKSIDVMQKDLASHEADLQSDYLEAVASLASDLQKSADLNQRGELNAFLAHAAQLATADREALNAAEMQLLSRELAIVVLAASKAESHTLESADATLDSVTASLQKAASLDQKTIDNVARDLANVEANLNAVATLGASLASRENYLNALTLEMKTLDAAQTELAAIEALGRTADLNSRLDNVARDLANSADQLESVALENMQARFDAQTKLGAFIANAEMQLNSAEQLAHSAQVGSRDLQSFDAALASLSKNLDNRSTAFESHVLANMQAEFAAIGSHLNSRELQNKTLQASMTLGSDIQNRAELANKTLGNRESLASFASYLSNVSNTLASSSLSAQFSNREQLNSQTNQLASYAADLQSRSAD